MDAATAGITAGTGAAVVKWFQYDGDTYLVVDNSDNATFTNGTDFVVKFTGLLDLSAASITTDVFML